MSTSFGLIIIGDEILSGKRADKHLPKTIELLQQRGLQLDYADYVGDSPVRIEAALKRAFASGDVVFSTGGIGATPDDHTRQCAARALGVELALHPQAAELIRERMRDTAREQGVPYEPDRHDNQHRLNMGVFPAGAEIIPNPYNKIAGFTCWSTGERAGVQPERLAGPPQAASAPSGGSDPHAMGERGGLQPKRRAGPPQAASAPLGGQRPTCNGGAWGPTFRTGFSGNGLAHDGMGARYTLRSLASKQSLG